MKVLLDSSTLIAAMLPDHVHRRPERRLLHLLRSTTGPGRQVWRRKLRRRCCAPRLLRGKEAVRSGGSGDGNGRIRRSPDS